MMAISPWQASDIESAAGRSEKGKQPFKKIGVSIRRGDVEKDLHPPFIGGALLKHPLVSDREVAVAGHEKYLEIGLFPAQTFHQHPAVRRIL